MDIAIIADNNKKELMAQFCIAYSGILGRHHLHRNAQKQHVRFFQTFLPGTFQG